MSLKMMNDIEKIVEIAEREFKAQGVPKTNKRINLFALLLLAKKAVSAYELVDSYHQMFEQPVPVITVYRVLEFLQSKGLVHKLETANKYVACSHIDCKQEHPASQFLICNNCLQFKELSISERKFDELKLAIEDAGFHLDRPQLEMNCICNVCYTAAQ